MTISASAQCLWAQHYPAGPMQSVIVEVALTTELCYTTLCTRRLHTRFSSLLVTGYLTEARNGINEFPKSLIYML